MGPFQIAFFYPLPPLFFFLFFFSFLYFCKHLGEQMINSWVLENRNLNCYCNCRAGPVTRAASCCIQWLTQDTGPTRSHATITSFHTCASGSSPACLLLHHTCGQTTGSHVSRATSQESWRADTGAPAPVPLPTWGEAAQLSRLWQTPREAINCNTPACEQSLHDVRWVSQQWHLKD